MLRFSYFIFDELTLRQLYEIMVLRQLVFVVEQDCPYLDADGKDPICHHILGYDNPGKLLAYARIVPPPEGISLQDLKSQVREKEGNGYKNLPAIGRIVTAPEARGKRYGKALVANSISYSESLYPGIPIKIQAQEYLLDFYKTFGFERISETYLEDDIPHLDMLRLSEKEAE